MSACNFSINTTEPIEQLIEKAKSAITSRGGSFEGSTESGNFSIATPIGKITGGYTAAAGAIQFNITDKPMLLGCGKIEEELKKYLS